jgi:hypothetical protein
MAFDEAQLIELQEKENRIFEINEDISEFVAQWYEQNELSVNDTLTPAQKKLLYHDLSFFTREKEMAIRQFTQLLANISNGH